MKMRLRVVRDPGADPSASESKRVGIILVSGSYHRCDRACCNTKFFVDPCGRAHSCPCIHRDYQRSGFGAGKSRPRRKRIGPLAVEGSTVLPPCVISIWPLAVSLRAACRAASMCDVQSPGNTSRAASLGQIDAWWARLVSKAMMDDSSA